MYWWISGERATTSSRWLPPYTDECGAIAAEDPDAAVGYGCDYAEDVLYKAFSAELETKDPAAFAFLSSFNWTDVDQNEVALQIQEGTDPSEAAQSWMDANPYVWQAWLPTA
jgi:glycine betaine/proline transport system substrate-binding protein